MVLQNTRFPTVKSFKQFDIALVMFARKNIRKLAISHNASQFLMEFFTYILHPADTEFVRDFGGLSHQPEKVKEMF